MAAYRQFEGVTRSSDAGALFAPISLPTDDVDGFRPRPAALRAPAAARRRPRRRAARPKRSSNAAAKTRSCARRPPLLARELGAHLAAVLRRHPARDPAALLEPIDQACGAAAAHEQRVGELVHRQPPARARSPSRCTASCSSSVVPAPASRRRLSSARSRLSARCSSDHAASRSRSRRVGRWPCHLVDDEKVSGGTKFSRPARGPDRAGDRPPSPARGADGS